jgi:hypothetical protein
VGDYYYEDVDADVNIENKNYLIAVNKKLAELGLIKLWEEVDSEEEDAIEIEGTSNELVSPDSSMEEDERIRAVR